ncbi:MAG TPA: hypothetical protein PKY59_20900, partial [Pyrinomonadaceae bacterium]|nr:hypothetical protein [Pyrinomonadaceae bacterium]
YLFLIVIAFGFQAVSAQFTLKIPKLPKVEKPKQDQTTGNDNGGDQSGSRTRNSKSGADNIYKNQRPTNVPVLLKNTIYVQAKTHNEYWKMPNQSNYSSWIPMIKFSQFYNNDRNLNYTAEYFNPDGSLWFSEKLEQGYISADRTVSFGSPNPYDTLNSKSTVATGVYSFKITDEDTKTVIYQGKFKVGKFSTGQRPTEKNKFDYFVDHDWLLPFGTVGFDHSDLEIGGINLDVSVWLKGMVNANELEGRIFYKGQEIKLAQDQIYKNIAVDYDERTTTFAPPFAPNNIWKRWLFQWHNFRIDNNGTFNRENYPNAFYADKNPGEYVVKIYRNGTQIRELSFTIGADGKIVVPSYSNQIPQPYYRVILPVKVLGTEKWDSVGWKTDAFYGNPLTGFNVQ